MHRPCDSGLLCHASASASLCHYHVDLSHCRGGLPLTHKRAVDMTTKDANSCLDPFQPLPSGTFSPEVGCVQTQSCPPFFLSLLSWCGGWNFSSGAPAFPHAGCRCLMLVLDSTQKTRPRDSISLVSIQVLC